MEKTTETMTMDEMLASEVYLEKTTFKLKTEFLTGSGKSRKIVFNNLAPGLGEEELYDKMCQLSELTLLAENPEDQWVFPQVMSRIEERCHKIIDHEADGSLLEKQRMRYLEELCLDHCQHYRISHEHLSENQREAIATKYWPFVLQKYPDKKPKRNQIEYIDGPPPQDGRKAVEKYRAVGDGSFPTMHELTMGNIWKACAKLKAYYHQGGEVARFLQGVRAIQLRTDLSNKVFHLKQDWIFRKELEAIYGKKEWCECAKELFRSMILLMSDLLQVQLVEMIQNEHRKAGLNQVVADTQEEDQTCFEQPMKEGAPYGGLFADIVTA